LYFLLFFELILLSQQLSLDLEKLQEENTKLEVAKNTLTKENTALRVKVLERKMQQKAPVDRSPETSDAAMILAKKERELEEERQAKRKAVEQLESMVKVSNYSSPATPHTTVTPPQTHYGTTRR